MSARAKGLLLAAIQIAIVLSLGAKLLYDRTTRPRVWVLAQVYDPDLPMRGRYLGERLTMPSEGFVFDTQSRRNETWDFMDKWAYFEIRDGLLIAKSTGDSAQAGGWVHLNKRPDGTIVAVTSEPVLLFLPDTADLTQIPPRSEVWVEVTVPKKGAPRPIRVGLKKDGVITPLHFN